MNTLEAIDPLPRTERGWIALGVIGVIIVVAFVLVVVFYNAEGGSRVEGGLAGSETGGIALAIEPVTVTPTVGLGRVHLALVDRDSGIVGSDGRLAENLRLTIGSGTGYSEVTFPTGTVLGQAETEIALEGELADYPFDKHSGYVLLSADTYRKGADGALVTVSDVPIGLTGGGGVSGWDTRLQLASGMSRNTEATLTFDRAFSTQVFTVLMITVAGLLAALALSMGILVQSGRRVAEAALLTWTAALLFALPTLRNFLPNSPPFGVSMDMYVFLWIMVAAGFAAVLMILGYAAQRRPPTTPAQS